MSFSSQIKEELARIISEKVCCQLAELSALLRIDGSIHIKKGRLTTLDIITEQAAVARKTIKLGSSLFQLQSDVKADPSLFKKGSRYRVYFPTQSSLYQALNEAGIFDDKMVLRYGIAPRIVKKDCCATSYLRGAFLAGGTIVNPDNGYHLELDVQGKQLALDLKTLMQRFEIEAKILERRRNFALYLKEVDLITHFLTLVGAYKVVLTLEDLRVLRGVRNRVNRLVNCETANLNKTIEAALNQVKDIVLIEEKIGLDSLPEGLCQIGKARLRHPQSSLKELGATFSPPLGKSAVNHRMRRIKKIALGLQQFSDNFYNSWKRKGKRKEMFL